MNEITSLVVRLAEIAEIKGEMSYLDAKKFYYAKTRQELRSIIRLIKNVTYNHYPLTFLATQDFGFQFELKNFDAINF
jgi:hypothetical protein